MDYLTLTMRETQALVRLIDDGGDGTVTSVQLSRRDSLDGLCETGFLVVSIIFHGEQERYAISETGSTSPWR
jgi:hypothetical protein